MRVLAVACVIGLIIALMHGETLALQAGIPAPRLDLNDDNRTDIVWYNASTGGTGVWLMNGATPSTMSGLMTDPNWKVTHTGDFDYDAANAISKTDLIWYNAATGQTGIWLMDGAQPTAMAGLRTDPNWQVTHVARLDRDANSDLVWYNAASGETSVWLMNGVSPLAVQSLRVDPNWVVAFIGGFIPGRFNHILWRNNATGDYEIWQILATSGSITGYILFSFQAPGNPWRVIDVADFDGDGVADLLWYNPATGATSIWLLGNSYVKEFDGLMTDPQWRVTQVADLDGDGLADLIWYNATTGETGAWLMEGGKPKAMSGLMTGGSGWSVSAVVDLDGDGMADLVWHHDTLGTGVWLMNGLTPLSTSGLIPDPAWRVANPATGDVP
jgi:hypothetical protein